MSERESITINGKKYEKEFLREVSQKTIQQFGGEHKYCMMLDGNHAPFTYVDGKHTLEGNKLYRMQRC
jgi:hypothetical protein